MPTPDLSNPSKLYRSPIAKGFAVHEDDDRVERDGGIFGAGLIRGMAIIERGYARGHDRFIDQVMLEQTRDAINGAEKGTKARWTHPSMSGDGLGRFLGRVKDARFEGNKVVADMHFSEAAHKTPEGDLATYLMDLAEEDADAAGFSISFEPDIGAEANFVESHRNAEGVFESPDDDNEKNHPHVRLHRLRAADMVDTPAATSGMFASPVASEADALLSYALGRGDKPAALSQFSDVDPDRVQSFVARYLENNNLRIVKEELMSDQTNAQDQTAEQEAKQPETTDQSQGEAGTSNAENNSDAQPETPQQEQGAGEDAGDTPATGEQSDLGEQTQTEQTDTEQKPAVPGARFMEVFGEQQGAIYFARGLSFEAAQAEHLKALSAENEALKTRLAASDRGIEQPLELSGEPEPAKPKGLKSVVKIRG